MMLPALLTTMVAALTVAVAAPVPQHHGPATTHADSVRVRRLRLTTGVELEFAERGRTDGQPVLFLHGFPDSRVSFERVVAVLPPDIRAIVLTQRGHGDSDHPSCCYRMTDLAGDAVALLDALGIQRAAVVGHSVGSFVAQRMAIDNPERVSHVVLIGSALSPRSKPVLEFSEVVKTLADPIPVELAREFQQSTLAQPIDKEYFEHLLVESGKVPARVWRDVMASVVARDRIGDVTRIRAKTLLVWGTKDVLYDRSQQDSLSSAIPSARLLVYQDAGHSLNWEEPARLAADLVAFLRDQVSAPGSPERHGAESHDHTPPAPVGAMPLLSGLGDWQMDVTTTSAEARRYFDQGLRLMYAFNHDEAARSFERAAQLDSTCALCHWGVAYATGPNINLPMDPAMEPRALAAARSAVRLKGPVTPRERDLIDAMVVRYGEPVGTARASRDTAFANAMRRVSARYPDDADIQVIFADAMLNLRPWNQWTREGQPQPGTLELVAALERVLGRRPDHAGACHFYIHAVEASETPERALPCAERLPGLMPGAGHVVHMPAHVYLRVGRYEEAARANIAAVNADGRYFASREVPEGIYPLFYAPHNLHFLWSTYLLSGQRAKALNTARALKERVRIEDARAVASLEGFLVAEVLALTRFGDWDAVMAVPAPPDDLVYTRGMWHYAQGMARAATGDVIGARSQLDSVRAIAARTPDDVIIILNPAPSLLKLAAEVLAGTIASEVKQHDMAIGHFRAAVRLEDGLTYDEPPPWYHPVRNLLGEALLQAGRVAEAEAAFREDLRFVRETGWSLAGLERALRAQGRKGELAEVRQRLEKAWQYADVPTRRGG
jgi:pimeloyl-ACP methyl ester carboxylesterase